MSARRDHRQRWLRDFTAAVIATLAAAAVMLSLEARGQGAPPDGATTVTTSAPITGSGTSLSPITCTEAGAAAAGCITTGAQTLGGKKTFAGGAAITEGTEALPGLAGEDDADTGIRLASAANTITMSTSATTRWTLTDASLTLTLPFLAANGAAATPSIAFANSSTTGFFRAGADEIGASTGGVGRWFWTSGHLVPWTSNTVDLGATATRVRAVYSVLGSFTEGVNIATSAAKPTCAVALRGRIWVTQGGAGVADVKEMCLKDAGDAYAWTAL